MGDKTKIEWTDASWNPIRARAKATDKEGWFCVHKSPGCINCYAETMNDWRGTGVGFKAQNHEKVELFISDKILSDPLRWQRPRLIFPCSMTDIAADFVTDEMLDQMFAVMALCPRHVFQVLTKRPERLVQYLDARQSGDPWAEAADHISDVMGWENHAVVLEPQHLPLPNVWIGSSVEDQARADERRDSMASLAAYGWKTWVSYEPALGPVDWHGWGFLRWLVAGGESGPRARPSHPDWHRSTRDWCAANDVLFNFKQWGEFAPPAILVEDSPRALACRDGTRAFVFDDHQQMGRVGKKAAGRLLDGVEHNATPEFGR